MKNNDLIEDMCYCNDGCLALYIIRETKNGKFELYGKSVIHGMGNAEYKKKILKDAYDQIVPFNTLEGTAQIALLKDDHWSLMLVIDDDSLTGRWTLYKDIATGSLDELKELVFKQGLSLSSKAWQKFMLRRHFTDLLRSLLRINIFWETVFICRNKKYLLQGNTINIPIENIIDDTVFYECPPKLDPVNSSSETVFSVVNDDCLLTVETMLNKGYNPCVLNMGNSQNPGGGVTFGSGAQEENIFRRSNLHISLYQFASYSQKYQIPPSEHQYPMNSDTGGIYSPSITVFRASEQEAYQLLQNPFKVSVVSVAAIRFPAIEKINGEYRIGSDFVEPAKEKIRTIFRIAGIHGHDSLVLSAFGCGAYKNPPKHMAELFKEVFEEYEFKNHFKQVTFAILDDHNAGREHNLEGNISPYRTVFNP